jgi:hypothetical protein
MCFGATVNGALTPFKICVSLASTLNNLLAIAIKMFVAQVNTDTHSAHIT